MKVTAIFLFLFLAVVNTETRKNMTNDENMPFTKDYIIRNMQKLVGSGRKHEVYENLKYLKPVRHNIHCNGTGHFNSSSFVGIWEQHGSSHWIIEHRAAQLHQYMITKTEIQNHTILTVGHVAANITGEKNIVKWQTKSYNKVKLELVNGSLITLSDTVSESIGQFIATTKRSGVFQDEAKATVNNTYPPMVIKVDSKNTGIAKADSRQLRWAGVMEGNSYLVDGMKNVDNSLQVSLPFMTKMLRPTQLHDPSSANWTLHYSGYLDKRHRSSRYHTSANEIVNEAGKVNNISIEAKGSFWEDDHHSLQMDTRRVFNKWLPTILDFIL